MKCSKCQAENLEGNKFCAMCGKPLERVCPNCGHENSSDSKFCGLCGTQLGEAPLPPPTSQTPPVEPIPIFEGERKQLTVLFADVKGSTALAVERDPEETRLLIEPVLQTMMEAVDQYGGTIIKQTGDGIMALFGAPIAYEDHAIRACYAALSMQKKIKEMKSGVSIRVGINSGEVVVDTIGTDARREYDAMGSAVNLSARMEQLAKPGMVQLTPLTLDLVKKQVSVTSRGKMEVKGLSEPLEVFELIGIAQDVTGFEQKSLAQLSDFVDRKKEMLLLEYNLEQALKGHGNCTALMGEPGVGKSRLAFEFMLTTNTLNVTHYECQCLSVNRNSPLFPIKQLLKRFFGITDETAEEQIKMIDKKLRIFDIDVTPFRNSSFSILDLPVDDPEWNALSPEFKRQKIMEGFVNLFIAVSEKKPFIMFIENLHWIDGESVECINKLIELLASKKIFLLLTFRLEFTHKWSDNPDFSQLKIYPLLVEDFELLANYILGSDESVKNLKTQLVERCNGNPFFLEETIRSLSDRHILEGEYGNYRLTTPSESIVLPRTVQSVLDARVDQLSYDVKKVLQTSSVIGHNIQFKLLQLLIPLSEEELNNVLETLTVKNFIFKTQDYPEVVFSFTQTIIEDAVYKNLLLKRKKQMHLDVLDCLEKKFPSDAREHIEKKANHAFKGGNWEKALTYYTILGDRAYEQSASLDGVEQYNKAAESFKNIEKPSVDQCKQAVGNAIRKAHLGFWLAHFKEPIKALDEALEISKKYLQNREIEANIKAILASGFCGVGEYEAGKKACHEALEMGKELKDNETIYKKLLANINFSLYHVNIYMGNYKETVKLAEQVLEYESNPFVRDPLIGTPFWSVSNLYRLPACGFLGDFKLAKKIRQEILETIKDTPPSFEKTIGYACVGISFCQQGEMNQAMTCLDISLEEGKKTQVYVALCPVLATKGFIFSLENKVEEAEEYLDKSLEIAKDFNFAFKTSWCLNYLCEGYLNLNKIEKAKFLMEKMFEIAEKRNQKGIEVFAWHYKAEIDSLEGSNPEDSFKRAIQLAKERDMLPEVAHCYRGLFQFYMKINEREKAEQAFQTANDLYESMGIKYWPEKMQEFRL